MNKIMLLDCTLRDGGYINNWNFGNELIRYYSKEITKTNIEFFEIGFYKNVIYDKDKTLFNTMDEITSVIKPKNKNIKYLAMIDMKDAVPLSEIPKCDGSSIDGFRIIFKKNKLNEAYEYIKGIKEKGYLVFVQFVSTNVYKDEEFIAALNKFNDINPYVISIVDTFGLMDKEMLLHYAKLIDDNINKKIILGYHAHDNLKQSITNAKALLDYGFNRNIVIDGSLYGMGRGAGNINLEILGKYLNENKSKKYNVEIMIEIIDKYIFRIYKDTPWGYTLPLYLSATYNAHPNYAIYLSKKYDLSYEEYESIFKMMKEEDKEIFTEEKAEYYYSKLKK